MLLMAKISIVGVARMVKDKQEMLLMKKLCLPPGRVQMVAVGTWLGMWTMEHTAMLIKTQKYSPGSCPGNTAC